MFNWLLNLVADTAYDAAIVSADLASFNGMYQMEEPANLQAFANMEKDN